MERDDLEQQILTGVNGNREDAQAMVTALYGELRALANRYLYQERKDHTLQPTALVHEAYARLMEQRDLPVTDRNRFFSVAASIMRRILIDHARAARSDKRKNPDVQVVLDDNLDLPGLSNDMALTKLDDALEALAKLDKRQSRIVEMRFFGGLSGEECARVLGISRRTINYEWKMAKAFLYRFMTGGNSNDA